MSDRSSGRERRVSARAFAGLLVTAVCFTLATTAPADATCGDSMITGAEVCDPPGVQGACAAGQVCNTSCTQCITCGNGVIDGGEACDPPGQQGVCASGQVCSADCSTCTQCGNGVIDGGEVCDPPGAQGVCDPGQVCDSTCSSCVATGCGNLVLEPGEICDGGNTCPEGYACSPDCQACSQCGNGVLEGGEFCDPPGLQGSCAAGQICNLSCTGCTTCGNGTLDPGESCDPPGSSLGSGGCGPDTRCRSDCQCVSPPLDRCQIELETRAATFHNQVRTALKKCSDAIRKEIAKNEAHPGYGALVRGAYVCQRELNRVFDTPGLRTLPGYRAKFFTAIDKATSQSLFATPKCTRTHLRRLGHLVSGAPASEAPGTDYQDFVKNWLAVHIVQLAVVEQVSEVRDFLKLLYDAINAPGIEGSSTYAATDCSLPSTCDPLSVLGCRPDLCTFRIQCRTHACQLAATSSSAFVLSPGTLSTNATGHAVMEVCNLKGFGYGLGDAGEGTFLVGQPGQATDPLNFGGTTICAQSTGAEGFCSCGGNFLGLKKDVSSCQDHISGAPDSDECPAGDFEVGGGAEDPCYCEGTSTQCGGGFPACPLANPCGVTSSGAPCHPGTHNGPLHLSLSDATAAGDCVLLNSLHLTVLPPGGDCNPSQTGGIDDNPASFGPDCLPCTDDDVAPPAVAVTVPFTSGTADATLKDAVLGSAACTNTASHGCVENVNCANTTNPGDLCDGTQTTGTLALTPVTGAPASSCASLQGGSLGGLALVGAAPVLDTAPFGDLIAGFSLVCQ
jgi:hypothetical protein